MKRHYASLPFKSWPAQDQEAWQSAISNAELFEDGGAASHWAEITRKQVRGGYGLWLGFLDRNDILDVNCPREARITRDTLEKYIDEIRTDLSPVAVVTRLRKLSEAIRVMAPKANRTLVVNATNRLARSARPSRNKRAKLVAPSDLYQAGLARMDRVEIAHFEKKDVRAVQYSDGLMMAMLTAKPVRMRNLAGTRLGRNLVRSGGCFVWRFEPEETKNGETIVAELPARLTAYIERWLSHHRNVLLRGRERDAMWISCYRQPMAASTLHARFCAATMQELGVRINPHAVRDIVATGVAVALPKDVQMIPFLLDHRSDRTTFKHYVLADNLSASARYLERLEARRREALAALKSGGT